ncbi:MAG: hypothetical protein PUC30_09635 [Lachnospiraceae bacterium]|nr:hypothetical protein [Lachnospiraceae bacterium]
MKFRRCMSAIYSSALVLGLTFLFYPQTQHTTAAEPVPSDIVTSEATLPADNSPADISNVPIHNPDSTPDPLPEQTLPSLLTDDTLVAPLSGVADLISSFINAYYANDLETVSALVTDTSMLSAALIEQKSANVSKVENLELYSKPGIDGIFSVVYATYSLYYSDTQTSVPQFSEYYVKRLADGSYRIFTTPLSSDTQKAFLQARKADAVMKLAVSSLIRRYHSACLTVNEPLLRECVTAPEYLNLDYIASRYSVTESFSDYDFILHPGINEFDYIVFVTHKEKIVFSDTPAPCMEYYYIKLDPLSGTPSIYLGITSLDTDAYCAAVTQSDAIQELAEKTNNDMKEALLADDDLKDFYQLLVSNSSADN